MKFVIHHHSAILDHYDLMLEKGNTLVTWQVPAEKMDLLIRGDEISAEKIQDHRKKYLNYEGTISCDRGRVDIFDSGEYRDEQWDGDNVSLVLAGKLLTGNLTIRSLHDNVFSIVYTEKQHV